MDKVDKFPKSRGRHLLGECIMSSGELGGIEKEIGDRIKIVSGWVDVDASRWICEGGSMDSASFDSLVCFVPRPRD